jgi:hypothetical protein
MWGADGVVAEAKKKAGEVQGKGQGGARAVIMASIDHSIIQL